MLKIYGSDLSSPSNKVRFAANAIGVPFDYVRVNLREGEHRKPEFLKLNPVGKIPVIDDDGFVLFESNAIIKYLAVKNISPLYPKDLNGRAIVDQWMDFISIHVGDAVARIMYNRVFAPRMNAPVDEQSIKTGITFLERYLPIVNNQLGKNRYIVGDRLSLADIDLLAILDPCEVAGVDLSKYTHLTKWRTALKQQPFYTKCHKEYGEQLKQPVSR